jgi:hypothetical protein
MVPPPQIPPDLSGRSRSAPGVIDRPLDVFLSNRLPPSASSVPAIYRETTICYAYMCGYAYCCTEQSARPAQVLRRRCMRYLPATMRSQPGVSELALDLLARRRKRGERLSPATMALLDKVRPDGPTRRQA